MEAEILEKLPICWEMIFNKLDHASDRDSISLVCKEFLSITNLIKENLLVVSPSIQILTRQLQRFPHLKKIQLINFLGDLNEAVLVIAQSGLNLEELYLSCNVNLPAICLEKLGSGMKNLKILGCSRSSLTDFDLVRIANLFPQLEELDISDSYFPHEVDGKIIAVTDEGIEFLSSKLKRLQRIDISGNQCISDKSLISLSSNCPFLQHIVVGYSMDITENGISFILHNSPQLTSLVLRAHFKFDSFEVKASASFPKYLQSLKFSRLKISDAFLNSIAKSHFPLTEFSLIFCKGYTFTGISSLLQSYVSLKSLALLGAEFLTNEHIDYLSPFLQNLSSIQLHCCPLISDSSFIILSERCHLLSRLEMGNSGLGREERKHDCHVKNFSIHFLNLSYNSYLTSSSLRRVIGICPNLDKLNLSVCFQGTEHLDIADIVDCVSNVRNLELNRCSHLKFSGEKAKVSKLERIVAQYSGMNDEILTMIGMNCPDLLHLNLQDCENVTEKGVKEVGEACKRLKYLNLSACSNVNIDVIEYLVKNRPTLSRLVSPSYMYPEEEEQKCLLQEGCLVTKGVDYEEFI